MPHKVTTMALLDDATPTAKIAGAANAILLREDGTLLGDQLDGAGFVRGVARKGFDVTGKRALVVGNGGVGSAIVASLAGALWGSRSPPESVTCDDQQPDMIADVSLGLLYLIFSGLVSWLTLLPRTSSFKDIELLVLRHEAAVLRRTNPKPRLHWADRALFAALIQRLPAPLRGHRLVTPVTVLWLSRELR